MKRENPENPLKTHREAGGDLPAHAHVSCPLNYYHSASAARSVVIIINTTCLKLTLKF